MRERSLQGAVAACVVLLVLLAGAAASDAQEPTCIGAATLDRSSGCIDRLTSVFPNVANPRNEYLPPCRPVRAAPAAHSCVIGAKESRAQLHFALIGDSHTEAWAAVLGELGRRRAWRGTVFSGYGCWMSEAVYELPAFLREACVSPYRQTMRWLRHHPEIDVVFVTHSVTKGLAGPVATIQPRKVLGFQQTFKSYPRNVRRVIVIADTPIPKQAQFDCVARAVLSAAAPAGPQCAWPRSTALRLPDAAVAAAAGLRSPRYAVVDMNDLMCSPSACYPALGGVLVNRDIAGHLTDTFALTMHPQLLRRLEPLLAGAPAAPPRVDAVSTLSLGSCALSDADADPSGEQPTFNLTVRRSGVSCAAAKRVVAAFHRCRSKASASCAKQLFGHWRCTGEKESSTPLLFYGTFACTDGSRRIRSSYQQNA
ncbi:MAG: hypothetical protein QOI73_590 [Solirubrobacteraceae bacterium]|nr:hypothetical protein [Solirubrobacteraceae bacterium]